MTFSAHVVTKFVTRSAKVCHLSSFARRILYAQQKKGAEAPFSSQAGLITALPSAGAPFPTGSW
jgi:hypothetical protein